MFISKKSQLTLAIKYRKTNESDWFKKNTDSSLIFLKKNTILTYGEYFPYVCNGKLLQFSVKHVKSNHGILLEVNYQVHLFKAAFCLAFGGFTGQ